ncbi:lipopolysaccharide biosynthesis protein [Winogradskyella sp.]|uniref:lipopolysaccharide biosynthesis protein n=1 Tax=Winogradskyella sp. TaxID=1883156 RepID=UPI003BAB9381
MSNKSQTINGIFWNLTERFGNKIIRFSLGIVLARILLPEDYGILALTSIVILFSEIISDGGYMMVLIQRKDNTQIEYSTVFWSKLLVTTIIFFVIIIASPFIADFYETPILKDVLRIISIALIINCLYSVHKTILTIALDFKGQAKIILISTIIGGLTGIVFALLGYGVWSLVFQTLTISAVQAVLFWVYSKWQPSLKYSFNFIKEIYNNSFYFLSSNILLLVYNNIYVVLVGKFFPNSTLGYYTRSKQFVELPQHTTNSVIVKVLFPIFTSKKNDKKALRSNTIETLSWVTYIMTPIMLLFIINSDQIIIFFLTKKWIEASDFLIILSIAGIIMSINEVIFNVFNILGKPLIIARMSLFKILFTGLLILLVWEYGILLTTSIIIIENLIVFIILCFIIKKVINLSFYDIVKSIYKVFVINLVAFLVIYFIINYLDIIGVNSLLHIIVTSIIYLTLIFFLSKFFKLKQLSFLKRISKFGL